MNTYFGYVRVSTVKQGEGVSIEAQKETIAAYAARNELEVCGWFEEKETAAKAGRPVFNDMVKALKKRQAMGLIVHKIDRSARNFRDWARIGELADDGVDIHFATETLDFGSRGGRLSADIQAVIAADFIRNLKEETRKGIQGRLKQGLYPFAAPLGYLNNGGGKPKTLDLERAALVKEMFRLYATGTHSIRSLRIEMAARGLTNAKGQPPSKSLIEKMLSNPFYCGIIRIQTTGATYNGIHEPLIDVETFQQVQVVKSGKCGKKITKHNHIYRGLFKCGHCGYAMIPELQKGRVYYRCHTRKCTTTSLREDAIEGAVGKLLSGYELTQEAIELLVQAVNKWVESRIPNENQRLSFERELKEIEDKTEALTDALIDRLIDKETYNTRREKLMLQKAEIAEKAVRAEDLGTVVEEVRKFLELVKSLAGLYQTLEPLERRGFVKSTTSNRIVYGKSPELEPCDWLQAVPDSQAVSYGALSRPKTRTAFGVSYSVIEGLVEAAKCDIPAKLAKFMKKELPNKQAGQF